MMIQQTDRKKVTILHENGDRIVLHTSFAKSLFIGSQKTGKFGLIQFANVINSLVKAEKTDDPYAALYLLRTYKAIREAREKIKLVEQDCQKILDNLRGLEISIFYKTNPAKLPIKFSNQFSYAASPILTDIDYVARLIHTLNRIGMAIPNGADAASLNNIVQEVFNLPREWKNLEIKRQDIIDDNVKAQQARALWGELPTQVLNKEIEFSFLSSLSNGK
jgi:integrating conjugative element protein (TIGR03761 family)